MKRKHLAFIVTAVIFTPLLSLAQAIEITSITGASNSDFSSAASTPSIYGGIAGPLCTSTSPNSTCDNCVFGSGFACNRERVHKDLLLRVNFKVLAEVTNQNAYWCYINSGGTTSALTMTSSSTSLSQNENGHVEVTWGTLCGLTETIGDADCDDFANIDALSTFIVLDTAACSATSSNNRLNINIFAMSPEATAAINTLSCSDSPNEGYCRFWAYPGDRKAYIGNVQSNDLQLLTDGACPDAYTGVRVFYHKDTGLTAGVTDFDNASYGAPLSTDLLLDEDCNPKDDWVVEDLDNDAQYFFRMSMLDIAKNNFFLTDSTQITTSVLGSENSGCGSATSAAARDATCSYITTPSEVFGLLPEDLNCFISTAAYGSGFVQKVQNFRSFRNRYLLTNSFGKILVEKYYSLGPKAAKYISDKPVLKSVVRAGLWPIWAVVWLTLQYGFWPVALALVGMTLVFRAIYKNTFWKGAESF